MSHRDPLIVQFKSESSKDALVEKNKTYKKLSIELQQAMPMGTRLLRGFV